MASTRHYLAVDLGATSGRVVAGRWDGERFSLEEVHRFPNGPVRVHDALHSDVLGLWRELTEGIGRARRATGGSLDAIGVDAWGVDFALLDRDGALVANPHHYRDRRTDGILAAACERVPAAEIFDVTGLQLWQINTLFQLFGMVRSGSAELAAAETLLPLPNLFYYWLGAERCAEYTESSTTQCLDVRSRTWANDLLARLGIPTGLFPDLVQPATEIGSLRPDLAAEAGLSGTTRIVAVGSHDTASAVAAVPGLDPTSAFVSSGTWSIMGLELRQPVINPSVLAGRFNNEGGLDRRTLLCRNLTGLWLLEECRRSWQRSGREYGWDELLALAEAARPFAALIDPEAPEFLLPDDMPSAIRSFCRRTGQAEPDDPGAFIRCCLESLAIRYRLTLASLEQVSGTRISALRIVGGGSRNRLLCQYAANAAGLPVIAGPIEATAFGNIVAQAIATGELSGLEEGRAAVARSIGHEVHEPVRTEDWLEAAERMRSWET